MLTAIVIQIAILAILVGFVIFMAVNDKRTQRVRAQEDEEARRRERE